MPYLPDDEEEPQSIPVPAGLDPIVFNRLVSAQRASNENALGANIADAGNRAGYAIAGIRPQGQDSFEALKKSASQPVSDFEIGNRLGNQSLARQATLEKIKAMSGAAASNLDLKNRSELETERHNRAMEGLVSGKATSKPSIAQTSVDREFGKEYNDWVVKGGFADAQKGLDQLKNASDKLSDNPNLTGPIKGKLPDFVNSIANPETMALKDQVEEVVQRNLRQVLGAQFTEKEGSRLIARSFNPSLSAEENKIRLGRLIKQMGQAIQSKNDAAKYFEANGSLKGFKGKLYNSADDFNMDGPSLNKKPPQVEQGDWDKASSEEKAALINHFGG